MPSPERLAELYAKLKTTAIMIDMEGGFTDNRYSNGVDALNATSDRFEFEDMHEAIADPGPMRRPTIGCLSGLNRHLFYESSMHSVFAPPSAGKSLLMTRVIADVLAEGHSAMWLDAEVRDKRHPFAQRVAAMGFDASIGDRLWFALVNRVISPANRDMFATVVENNDVKLVVMDSLGEFLGLNGKDANKDGDVQWGLRFFEPLAEAGAAVVFIDHPSKSDTWSASGSMRKGAHLDATYAINADLRRDDRAAIVERSFSRNKPGFSRLYCIKDRNGNSADYECLGRMNVTPWQDGERLDVTFEYDNGDDEIDEMIGENRQPVISVDKQLEQIVHEASLMPQTAQTVRNNLRLKTKVAAEELLTEARDRQLLMWSKQHEGYIPVTRL